MKCQCGRQVKPFKPKKATDSDTTQSNELKDVGKGQKNKCVAVGGGDTPGSDSLALMQQTMVAMQDLLRKKLIGDEIDKLKDNLAKAQAREREAASVLAKAEAARRLAAKDTAAERGFSETEKSREVVKEFLFEVKIDDDFLESAEVVDNEESDRQNLKVKHSWNQRMADLRQEIDERLAEKRRADGDGASQAAAPEDGPTPGAACGGGWPAATAPEADATGAARGAAADGGEEKRAKEAASASVQPSWRRRAANQAWDFVSTQPHHHMGLVQAHMDADGLAEWGDKARETTVRLLANPAGPSGRGAASSRQARRTNGGGEWLLAQGHRSVRSLAELWRALKSDGHDGAAAGVAGPAALEGRQMQSRDPSAASPPSGGAVAARRSGRLARQTPAGRARGRAPCAEAAQKLSSDRLAELEADGRGGARASAAEGSDGGGASESGADDDYGERRRRRRSSEALRRRRRRRTLQETLLLGARGGGETSRGQTWRRCRSWRARWDPPRGPRASSAGPASGWAGMPAHSAAAASAASPAAPSTTWRSARNAPEERMIGAPWHRRAGGRGLGEMASRWFSLSPSRPRRVLLRLLLPPLAPLLGLDSRC
ncbi:unnamed protein product [Prorocentrum cordatum]|uniref:Uncharacterized protein n=1 Tax=Prorocentrum cordatum TaxID=2364126 RepID=A0ABN9SCX3_9DINO|nr:unnamed protein product [Polarella glacialis]